MNNDLSLTVRLPRDLSRQMKSVCQKLGMTRTNLIRSAIHDFLTVDGIQLDFPDYTGEKDRLVLNLNQLTYDILNTACQRYNQSMNAVIVAISVLALERASKWLQATRT